MKDEKKKLKLKIMIILVIKFNSCNDLISEWNTRINNEKIKKRKYVPQNKRHNRKFLL